MLTSLNNVLVCTPIEKAFNEPVAGGKSGKLLLNKTVNILESVTVLVDAAVVKDGYESTIKAGSIVYISSEVRGNKAVMTRVKCPEVTQEVEVEGKKVTQEVEFILVPFDMVKLVKAV